MKTPVSITRFQFAGWEEVEKQERTSEHEKRRSPPRLGNSCRNYLARRSVQNSESRNIVREECEGKMAEAGGEGGRAGQPKRFRGKPARREFLARKDFRPELFLFFQAFVLPFDIMRNGCTATDEISSELRYTKAAGEG